MSGARVALSSIPGRGITVDGVVAVMLDDTLITKQKVMDGATILKGQAVAFDNAAPMRVRPTVVNEAGVFAGIAHSSGTMDTATYNDTIPVISVVRGPVGRGIEGEDLSAATYAKAGADGKFFVAADLATSHARVRGFQVVEDFGGTELRAVDLEFFAIGK